jgi:UDP-N-acetylglucosamine--N-acetylmuramyl-(pentapeptide) pyrophosphoryl-undecaprenol N-acetylglucosamine transferase
MGSFTSAPPILAGKICGARTFLHESNTIPGRANRWLARLVNGAFVGFPCAAGRLKNRQVSVTGTPVRPSFKARDAAACRLALGLDPAQPVVVITGGSQGASGLNELVLQALPLVARLAPELQWFHLAGTHDVERVSRVYAELGLKAVVHPFFDQMELVLGAASAAISRAGASSLAELAALRVPSLLVPYPIATDNHQFHNARSFADTGAARLLEQERTTPQSLAHSLLDLVCNTGTREEMQAALARWQSPRAAEQIAETMLEAIGEAKSSAFAGPALEALGLPDTFLLNPPEAVADSESSLAERAIV